MGRVPSPPDHLALRRAALGVSVLDDVDLLPWESGVLLGGGRTLEVTWSDMRRAMAGADPDSDRGRRRLHALLRGTRLVADTQPEVLAERARPVGLPVEHPLHPGLDWVRHRVMGGALDLGLGFVGVGVDPDEVVVVPHACLLLARLDPAPWWPPARDYLERMGALAATRLISPTGEVDVLRPIGDCDVVTLLGSRAFRTALCRADGSGMRAAAAPMRTRGWVDLRRIDPAFSAAASAATELVDRGFDRPVLLTADEITHPPGRADVAAEALSDPAAPDPLLPPVLYR